MKKMYKVEVYYLDKLIHTYKRKFSSSKEAREFIKEEQPIMIKRTFRNLEYVVKECS